MDRPSDGRSPSALQQWLHRLKARARNRVWQNARLHPWRALNDAGSQESTHCVCIAENHHIGLHTDGKHWFQQEQLMRCFSKKAGANYCNQKKREWQGTWGSHDKTERRV